MQKQLSFLEKVPPDEAAPVWAQANEEHRTEVVQELARLIAKLALKDLSGEEEEPSDE